MSQSMQLKKEQAALAVVRRLTGNGYQALYAGGCVRDMLLNAGTDGDIDIATNATPETVASLFEQVIGVGEHFGVMIVVIDGIPFEVATFRSDIGSADGRHPGSVVFVDAEHDAQRRDFTINGMFYDPITEQIFDYVGGREDLEKKVVRAIGNPMLRFEEDYLRVLRAVRFSARLGFPIESTTWTALKNNVAGLSHVSVERIFQECDKMLMGANPDTAIKLMHESGLLARIFPEVSATIGVEQPPEFHPEGDVFVHTLLVLSLLRHPLRTVAWSALLHDIGKPPTKTISDRIRFSNHQRVGAVMAKKVMLRLKAPNSLVDNVYDCIDNHMNFMNVKNMRLSTLKRFLSRSTFEDEMELHRADCLASHGNIDNYDFLRQKQREIPVDEVKPPALLTGKDLIALGFVPGPNFKVLLSEAYDLQLEGKITSAEAARVWAQEKAV